MIGACEDCPSSSITLKQGVEKMLMHYIPEVKRVLSKGDEELPLEERERQSNAERKEMEYLDNFNRELDRMIAEEKARMKEEAKKKLDQMKSSVCFNKQNERTRMRNQTKGSSLNPERRLASPA